MTTHVSITNNERTGAPLQIDVHHREHDGSVHPVPVSTYTIAPTESRSFALRAGRVLVLRETTPIDAPEETNARP